MKGGASIVLVPAPRGGACWLGLICGPHPFAKLERAPNVTWLGPRRVVAELSYSEMMEGRLRDPVLRELRVIPARLISAV